jgi:hypothetical protein
LGESVDEMFLFHVMTFHFIYSLLAPGSLQFMSSVNQVFIFYIKYPTTK